MSEEEIKQLGKYRIERVLGKGAMGVVYEGFDVNIERRVAIKTIHKALLQGDTGHELLIRFKREAQSAGKLMHPHIVGVYEYGEEQGTPYIAMEFIEGKELKDFIREKTRFTVEQIVDIIQQTLDALGYCHQNGVFHRDIKPANIILLPGNQVKVADFGIARTESSTMTQVGQVMGTPSYMSPEQFMGQRVDARADLFSLGVILYELLTGEKPFPGQAVAVIMQKVLNAQFDAPTNYNYEIPRSFDDLMRKALAKRPGDRFQTAKEFSEGLKLAMQDKFHLPGSAPPEEATMMATADEEATILQAAPAAAPAQTPRPTPAAAPVQAAPVQTPAPPPAPPEKSGPPMGLIAAGVAGLLILGGAGWWFSQGSAPPAPTAAPATAAAPATPATAPAAAAASQRGTINASTNPSGAVIEVDKKFMGTTPSSFQLPPGTYQLALKKEGFEPVEGSLEVEAGGSLDFHVDLNRK